MPYSKQFAESCWQVFIYFTQRLFMLRIGIALLALLVMSCGNDETSGSNEEEGSYSYERLSKRFNQTQAPYVLTDTGLVNYKDTAAIRFAEFTGLIDTVKKTVFGNSKPKYIPLAMLKVSNGETYFIVKASAANKHAAYILAFDKEQKFGAVFPFLIPDTDKTTTQTTSIDKTYSITRTVAKRTTDDVLIDRKEVYGYSLTDNKFRLILTDLFDDTNVELINPIDTLPKTHKYAGDYFLDKNSLVSVRDGRSANQLNVFIHLQKNKGECTGELKGEILVKDNFAAFRQSGNPCVLELKFGSNSVTLKEEGGCGSSRGIECSFDGTYSKNKESKAKTSPKSK